MPAAPHHVIESLEVTAGHLAGLSVTFADGLNTIIGGTGAGKTTLLQLLCFALGTDVTATQTAVSDQFIKGVLRGGRVTVKVRTQHGVRYTASRVYGEPPTVTNEHGEPASITLDGDLFKIEIYGLAQIGAIAESPSAQLALLDKFVEPEARAIGVKIAEVTRALARNAEQIQRYDRDDENDAERIAELPSVEEALKGVLQADGPSADDAKLAFEHRALRGREADALARAKETLATTFAALDTLAKESSRRLGDAVPADLDAGPNKEHVAKIRKPLTAVQAALKQAVTDVAAKIETAIPALETVARTLAAVHAKQDAAYQTLVAQHDKDRERATTRERLQQRHLELSAVARRVEDRKAESSAARKERERLLLDLARLRDERFALRAGVARKITDTLDGQLRFTVKARGRSDAYFALLQQALAGANVRPADIIKEIAKRISPEHLVTMIREDDAAPIVAIDDSKTGKNQRATHILGTLRASGRIHELEAVELEDAPLIELRTTFGYQASNAVSAGQRSTCIMPILLLRSESPLLIDQPEDSLDGDYISNVFVETLLKMKGMRQFIFATHNANIPANGDAELVVFLMATNERGEIALQGDADACREPCLRLLDGGPEAFRKRAKRYGREL